ncbi:adenine glycosylase [Mangrovimonas yunxiaonensis]|uniref:Adenine DNA glycosylase n=1 Tax=Mangrovimonas yunxiaonensis TaxID=1197477 RepID=A0A084TLB3_9FLAO|nr:A/G-specific adenine glycosylase [Mangrovimonas yunxiaonensis]KFB01499.1 adenine glycosylase [Mangrovimonas yunxiaonensis]GGH36308.1 A/G-specific adenine glycosylase [Mangrovimonas yunxiaonensis]
MTFTENLTSWYSVNKRDFPWRNTTDPYRIWLSEIILQQTQIKQGLPYYQAFVKRFPKVYDLAQASQDDVLKLWQGLGYYSRARNLHETAKHVAFELDGVFPTSYSELLKLKGVGDYTASAIASICFNEPKAVLDGNVYRVLSRYFGVDAPINTTSGFKVFRALAQDNLDVQNPAMYNQAIMDFGATQCTPKKAACNTCPLITACTAYSTGTVSELPVKIKAKKPKNRYFNFLVYLSKDKKTIVEQRKANGIWKHLYQFPLIESEKALPYNALKDRLDSELKVDFDLRLYNKQDVVHKLSHQHLHTKFWIIDLNQLPQKGISIAQLSHYAVPVVIENFIKDFNF